MSAETKRVDLGCGGFVRLHVEADWLAMSDADVQFVRGLARHLEGYGEAAEEPTPPPEFPCPECDRTDFVNAAGLAVHRRAAHDVASAAAVRAEERDGRRETDEARYQCGKCERIFLSGAGLGRHRKSCTSTAAMPSHVAAVVADVQCLACPLAFASAEEMAEHLGQVHPAWRHLLGEPDDRSRWIMQDAVDDEDDWTPPVPSIAPGAHPVHRLGEKRRKGHDHVALCACGWESDPCVLASDAADALAAHIETASPAMEVA